MSTLFVYKQNSKKPVEVLVEDSTIIEVIVKEHAPQGEEIFVYAIEIEEEHFIDQVRTVHEARLKHGHGIVLSKCKKIHVAVHYMDHTFNHPFNPHNTIGKILHDALSHFIISPAEVSQFGLFLEDKSKEPLPGDVPVSAYSHECTATFYLSKIIDIKG